MTRKASKAMKTMTAKQLAAVLSCFAPDAPVLVWTTGPRGRSCLEAIVSVSPNGRAVQCNGESTQAAGEVDADGVDAYLAEEGRRPAPEIDAILDEIAQRSRDGL